MFVQRGGNFSKIKNRVFGCVTSRLRGKSDFWTPMGPIGPQKSGRVPEGSREGAPSAGGK